jgi:outer membrane immunogenic protein
MGRDAAARILRTLNVIVGAGALVWMSVGPARAADIPAAPVYYKAPIAAPVVQNWYGFFIGPSGGYAWGRNGVDFTPFAAAGVTTSAAGTPTGLLGGIQWGSNWQFNRVVIGTIGDVYYSDIKASQTLGTPVGAVGVNSTIDQHLKWFGTTRLRGGVLATDNMLLYVSGGLASGEGQSSFMPAPGTGCPAAGCPFGSASKNMWGWAGGAGIEFMNGPWSARVEYLHYDLGTLSYAVAPPLSTASARMSGDLVLGSISYRFNWTLFGLLFGSDHF